MRRLHCVDLLASKFHVNPCNTNVPNRSLFARIFIALEPTARPGTTPSTRPTGETGKLVPFMLCQHGLLLNVDILLGSKAQCICASSHGCVSTVVISRFNLHQSHPVWPISRIDNMFAIQLSDDTYRVSTNPLIRSGIRCLHYVGLGGKPVSCKSPQYERCRRSMCR